MTHLILHKVRGEPAFDVAEQMEVGDETWWIIPTSGHRAYPYRTWKLDNLSDISDINSAGYHGRPATMNGIPEDWPDHYTIHEAPAKKGTGQTVDFSLILSKLMKPMKRRF